MTNFYFFIYDKEKQPTIGLTAKKSYQVNY